MTGQIGRPGTGLHPLRGQNNVQGASDVGLIPMMYPGLPAGRQRRCATQVRSALEHASSIRSRADGHRDHRRASIPTSSTGCTSWEKIPPCRIPTSSTRAKRWRNSSIWSSKTSSSPRRRATRTSSCPPRRFPRRRARSPTPIVACSSAGRRSTRRAKRDKICGSSRRSRAGSASTGPTPVRPRSSRGARAQRRAWPGSRGNGWRAKARARTRSSTKAIPANR